MHRKELAAAMARVPETYAQVQDEFEEAFGRRPADAVTAYRMDDAEIVLVSMGTTASSVRAAIDEARDRGVRAGALRVRMFRPFPERDLVRLLASAKRVGVIDRDLCPGLGGILWSEMRCCAPRDAVVQNYMMGLGGGDVRTVHVRRILDDLASHDRAGDPQIVELAA